MKRFLLLVAAMVLVPCALMGLGGGNCPGDQMSCIYHFCSPTYGRCSDRCLHYHQTSPTGGVYTVDDECMDACDIQERSCEAGCANVANCYPAPQ